jgi:murein DD-endopeptidase MepM/ murein hydrolase activator NlpD
VKPAPEALPTEVRDVKGGERAIPGVVHVVKKGETLWRIARAYGITPADLMETNGISDPRAVPAGMELFVPGATRVVEVPPAPGSPAPAEADPAEAATPPRPARPPSAAPVLPAVPPSPSPQPAAQAAAPSRPPGPGGLAWPVQGALTARFGVRDGERHDGIDLAAPDGTPVAAAADGVVLWTGTQAGYGRLVILRHPGGLLTIYAHLADVAVRDGAKVRRGDVIARVGKSGGTDAAQLHFEVREGTRPRNPLLYLP